MKDIDVKEKFIELRSAGQSLEKVAKKIGKSKQTMVAWSRELELQISNARSLRLDALREQMLLTKEARLKRLASTLDRLEREIESRDFGNIPTTKLLALASNYRREIASELDFEFQEKEMGIGELDLYTTVKWQAEPLSL